MDDRRLDDILRRLDDIERYLERHAAWHQDDYTRRDRGECRCHCHEHHGYRHHDHHHDDHDRERREGFEEKRIVDLIVRLVAEKVDELLYKYEQRRAAPGPAEPSTPPPEGQPPQ